MPAAELRTRLAALRPHALAAPTGRRRCGVAGCSPPVPCSTSPTASPMRRATPASPAASHRRPGDGACRRSSRPAARPPPLEPDRLVRQSAPDAACAPRDQTMPCWRRPATAGRSAAPKPDHGAGATSTPRPPIDLPPELRNQLSRLRARRAPPGAGSVALLDERRAAGRSGCCPPSAGGGDTPLLGQSFYVDRALAPTAELRHGNARHHCWRARCRCWSLPTAARGRRRGRRRCLGEAGRPAAPLRRPVAWPRPAATHDPLLPVHAARRRPAARRRDVLEQAAKLAPFPAGLPSPACPCRPKSPCSRQVLAEPSAQLHQRGHLGHAGRRHPAGHRRHAMARASSCCST